MIPQDYEPNPTTLDSSEVVARIVRLTQNLRAFWQHAHGWASPKAAELLSQSRLDRQVSLSTCLHLWIQPSTQALGEGALILAWLNLGSLVEGALKLYFAVYYDDYTANPYLRNKTPVEPQDLQLEQIRQFLESRQLLDTEWRAFVKLVQERRNAIHFFKHRPIGDFSEFHLALGDYLRFLRDIGDHLPYPDEASIPWEAG